MTVFGFELQVRDKSFDTVVESRLDTSRDIGVDVGEKRNAGKDI